MIVKWNLDHSWILLNHVALHHYDTGGCNNQDEIDLEKEYEDNQVDIPDAEEAD